MVDLRNVILAGSLALTGCSGQQMDANYSQDKGRIGVDCVGDTKSSANLSYSEGSAYNCQLINFPEPIAVAFYGFLVGDSQLGFLSAGKNESLDDYVPLIVAGDLNADGKVDAIKTKKGTFFRGLAHVRYCENKMNKPYLGRFRKGIFRESGFCSFDGELDESPEAAELFSTFDLILSGFYEPSKKISSFVTETEAPDVGKQGKGVRRIISIVEKL